MFLASLVLLNVALIVFEVPYHRVPTAIFSSFGTRSNITRLSFSKVNGSTLTCVPSVHAINSDKSPDTPTVSASSEAKDWPLIGGEALIKVSRLCQFAKPDSQFWTLLDSSPKKVSAPENVSLCSQKPQSFSSRKR